MLRMALLFLMIAVSPAPTFAKQQRSTVERHAFVKSNPCPATGHARLPCPGYQIDHVAPLCAGGADHRGNLQWLTVADHKAKTRVDVKSCRLNLEGRPAATRKGAAGAEFPARIATTPSSS